MKKAIKESICATEPKKCGKKIGFKRKVLTCDIKITPNSIKLYNGCNFFYSQQTKTYLIKQKQIVLTLCNRKHITANTVNDHCTPQRKLPHGATDDNIVRNTISSYISTLVLTSLNDFNEKDVFKKYMKKIIKFMTKKVLYDKKKIYILKQTNIEH